MLSQKLRSTCVGSKMIKYICLSIFFCLIRVIGFAQADSSKTTLTVAAMYSSNANYYGQTTDQKFPLVLTNATVRLPMGLYFASSIYQLINTEGGTVVALGAGYDYSLTEKLTVGLGFNHTFFPTNSPLLQASNAENINASVTYNYWLTSALSADYAFGKEQDFFITLTNSKAFSLGSLFSDEDYISIEPGVEIVAGTQHFYDTYITKKNNKANPGGKPNVQQQPVNNGNGSIVSYVPASKFSLLSYNLKMPLAYNRSTYLIEAAYQLSILGKQVDAVSTTPKSFFNLSFYYQF
ncbi:hypothetical protein D3C80_389810 [compost metagenome]